MQLKNEQNQILDIYVFRNYLCLFCLSYNQFLYVLQVMY